LSLCFFWLTRVGPSRRRDHPTARSGARLVNAMRSADTRFLCVRLCIRDLLCYHALKEFHSQTILLNNCRFQCFKNPHVIGYGHLSWLLCSFSSHVKCRLLSSFLPVMQHETASTTLTCRLPANI
jgi:hypothetical protein